MTIGAIIIKTHGTLRDSKSKTNGSPIRKKRKLFVIKPV